MVGRAADRDLDVDDIVQETMLGLIAGLPGLRAPERLRSWVVTIAVRRLADARSAARRQRLARGAALADLVEARAAAPARGPQMVGAALTGPAPASRQAGTVDVPVIDGLRYWPDA